VFASGVWMRSALVINLAGVVLLFFSFQATSSKARIVTTKDGWTALCVESYAVFIAKSGEIGMGVSGGCPEWQNAKSVAVVNIEKPILLTFGFLMTALGFLIQFLSIPSPKTIAQMRRELKDLEKTEKLRKKLERESQS
jgi:hypothetical protein